MGEFGKLRVYGKPIQSPSQLKPIGPKPYLDNIWPIRPFQNRTDIFVYASPTRPITNRYTPPVPALHSMWGIAQPTQLYTPQLQHCCLDISKLRQSLQYVVKPLSVLPPSITQSHALDNNNMACSK
ncbi:Armadillo repeat-containing 8 [Gossypium arboreum]|uniref:Armadillo repeat-containing 8 n=1 Tax=Gossypium arboreum TaxID=29729 RepID=A0A0B0NG63_GOSAR|nr:Armadillo repeat-containing 8 [Gossypium arboreum]